MLKRLLSQAVCHPTLTSAVMLQAASAYYMAKKIVRLTTAIGETVNNDPDVSDLLKAREAAYTAFLSPDLRYPDTLLEVAFYPVLPVLNKPHICGVPEAVVPMAALTPVHRPDYLQAAWLSCLYAAHLTLLGHFLHDIS